MKSTCQPVSLVQRAVILALFLATGCAKPPWPFEPFVTRLEIADLSDAQNIRRYQEDFVEAFYDLDGHGNLNLVLRRKGGENSEGGNLTQVVRVRTVWRPVANRSVSKPTQINAVVSYYAVGGRVGDTFEGAGAVFFHASEKDVLEGSVDRAVLRAKRQLSSAQALFPRAELSGKFRAIRDRRQVVRIVNELEQQFGPLRPEP